MTEVAITSNPQKGFQHSVIRAHDPDTNQIIGRLTYHSNLITNIRVLPESRRQGIASLLVDEAEDQIAANGHDEVILFAVSGPPQRFWTTQGYTLIEGAGVTGIPIVLNSTTFDYNMRKGI